MIIISLVFCRDENTQLSDDYKRITEQFRDLQRKSRFVYAIVK